MPPPCIQGKDHLLLAAFVAVRDSAECCLATRGKHPAHQAHVLRFKPSTLTILLVGTTALLPLLLLSLSLSLALSFSPSLFLVRASKRLKRKAAYYHELSPRKGDVARIQPLTNCYVVCARTPILLVCRQSDECQPTKQPPEEKPVGCVRLKWEHVLHA